MKKKILYYTLVFVLLLAVRNTVFAEYEQTAVPFSLDAVERCVSDDFANTRTTYGDAMWTVNEAAGDAKKGWGWFWFDDKSKYAGTEQQRDFRAVSNKTNLMFGFKIQLETYTDGLSYQLRNDKTPVASITTKNGALYYEQPGGEDILVSDTIKTDSAVERVYIRVDVNQVEKKADVYYRGKHVINDAPLLNNETTANNIYIKTSDEAVGKCYLQKLYLLADYFVNEYALEGETETDTVLPETMSYVQDGGKITSSDKLIGVETQGDRSSFLITSTPATNKVSARADFDEKADWVTYNYKFCQLEKKTDGFIVNMGDGISIKTKDGDLCYRNGDGQYVSFYKGYWPNVVYAMRINANYTTNCFDVYINGTLRLANAPMASGDYGYIEFTADPGADMKAVFDNIEVYERLPEPEDYVEEPIVADSSQLLGMISCSLWEIGQQQNWPCITAYKERTPYLGYYDGNSVEVADWETKWMAEHGIDFRMYCWFNNTQDKPFNSASMRDYEYGKRYSKYKDKVKNVVMIENWSSTLPNIENFKIYTLPGLIEGLFKDDNYLKIDNKPVISIYSVPKLETQVGKENVNLFIQTIKDACVAEGFDGAYVMAVSGGSEYNFDAYHVYHYGNSSGDVSVQTSSMERYKIASNNKFIPTVVQGWDPEPWNQPKGKFVTVDEFRDLCYWVRDKYQPSLPTDSDARKMVIFDNWNEFGEGHIIAPMNYGGFGYLDAIREVFARDSKHEDKVPTENQKERITKDYDNSRVFEKKAGNQVTGDYPTKVIKEWNFDNTVEGWTKGYVTPIEQKDGALVATSVNNDPQIYSPSGLNIEIGEGKAEYIKVRVKSLTGSEAYQMFFTTTDDKTVSASKSIKFQISANGDYVDCYINMAQNNLWTGTLNQLRFDIGAAPGDVYIDYVQILGFEKREKDTTIFDGLDKGIVPVTVDGAVMIPFRQIMELKGMKVGWYSDFGEAIAVSKSGDATIRVAVDSNIILKNGKSIVLDSPVKLVDGTTYIPIDYMDKIMGYNIGYDGEKNILNLAEGIISYKFSSGSLAGWTLNDNFSVPVLKDSALVMKTNGLEAEMVSPDNLNLAPMTVKSVNIKYRNNTPSEFARLYYTTTKDADWTAEKSVVIKVKPNDTSITEYKAVLPEEISGKIKQIKFIPTSDKGDIAIESIEFAL